MSAGVEGVSGARQECDIHLVITCGFGGILHWTTEGLSDTIRIRKRKRTRKLGCFFFYVADGPQLVVIQ